MADNIQEQNKKIFRNLIEESDKGNLSALEQFYSVDYIDHTPSPVRGLAAGREGIIKAAQLFYEAFPDTQHTIEHLIAEGDKVVAHVSAKGTHQGEFFGLAPTNKAVTLSGIGIYRMVNGKIVERWAYNGIGVLEQLGIEIPDEIEVEKGQGAECCGDTCCG